MNVREKLVELVDKARIYAANKCHGFMSCAECDHYGKHDGNCRNTYIAESLIAHGVTVQEWISVKDRLPEIGQRVLVWCESKTIEKHVTVSTYMTTYSATRKTYFSRHVRNVTHWMPLPEPPRADMRGDA